MTPSRLLGEYVAIAAERRPSALGVTTLRTRSRASLDLLAHLATSGRHTFERLQRHLAEARHDPVRTAVVDLEPLDPAWTARLARTLALQNLESTDRSDAFMLYRYLVEVEGGRSLPQRHADTCAQLMFQMEQHALLERNLSNLKLSGSVHCALQADLANPFAQNASGPTPTAQIRSWLRRLNVLMSNQATEPDFTVDNSASTPFDSLRSTSSRTITDGPLISVIVPCYKPDQGLATAVRSLTQQTWRNCEILIVDDGSPPEYREIIHEVTATDPRIRLLTQPKNAGAYRARNAGLRVARGDFITVQDADDWSHPERLERQVAPLIATPHLVASRSRCVRVSPDLVVNHLGYRPLRANASSLLFRRELVTGEVGFFDDGVRKGADSEYHFRLLARYGENSVEEIRDRLAIIRLTQGSLSRSDFQPGWRHSARTFYRSAYTDWHRKVTKGESPYVEFESKTRRFPAPQNFLVDPPASKPHYDVAFVGDWRRLDPPQRSMLSEIDASLSQGLTVGIAHLEDPRFMTDKELDLCDPIAQRLSDDSVHQILLPDHVEVDLLILRDPPILQFPPAEASNWQVKTTWILASLAPSARDGSDLRYIVPDCTKEATRLFHREPIWVPQAPSIRGAIERHLPTNFIASFDFPGVLDPSDLYIEHRPWDHTVARVGRYSGDNAMAFPASGDALLDAYSHPQVSVRMMGGTKQVPTLLGGRAAPANWSLLHQRAMRSSEFLRSIDFFVYYDNPKSHESVELPILKAIASGCVVILPHSFAAVFGEAAVYRHPTEAMSTVLEYQHDERAFSTHVSRALRTVERRFGHSAFISRLRASVPALHGTFPH